jgi:hypothetical protein
MNIEAKISEGAYFDFVDPSSGILMKSENSNITYQELQGVQTFLPEFPIVQLGMCQAIRHPLFGLDCYPATMFTNIER